MIWNLYIKRKQNICNSWFFSFLALAIQNRLNLLGTHNIKVIMKKPSWLICKKYHEYYKPVKRVVCSLWWPTSSQGSFYPQPQAAVPWAPPRGDRSVMTLSWSPHPDSCHVQPPTKCKSLFWNVKIPVLYYFEMSVKCQMSKCRRPLVLLFQCFDFRISLHFQNKSKVAKCCL